MLSLGVLVGLLAAGSVVGSDARGRLPVAFETNLGQFDSKMRFVARSGGAAFAVTDEGTALAIPSSRTFIEWRYVNGRRSLALGADPAAGVTHYLMGNNPSKFRTGVTRFERVSRPAIYPGIDVTYYATDRLMEHDFIVAPGADPGRIEVEVNGARGLAVDSEGDLILKTDTSTVVQKAPVIYQAVDGRRLKVEGRYRLKGGSRYAFEVGAYDRTRPLVIDPVLVYSTPIGGSVGSAPGTSSSGTEELRGIAVDGAGNAYVVGTTLSTDFPTRGPIQSSKGGGYDVFVAKFSPEGALVYSTYLGGAERDLGNGIAVDAEGSAYVVGETSSANFPTASPMQAGLRGPSDAFLVKLSPSGGSLVYATYLGGSFIEFAHSVKVITGFVSRGSAVVGGTTHSNDFPATPNAYQQSQGGGYDAFVAKFSPEGTALSYSTYVGGSGHDILAGLALDPAEDTAYIAGRTESTDYPLTRAVRQTKAGQDDGFVTRLSLIGPSLQFSTYLGGNGRDQINGVAAAGTYVYVAGRTESPDFPTLNGQSVNGSFQRSLLGDTDAFVTKFDATGGIYYSTFLGAPASCPTFCLGESASGIAADAQGRAYVTGSTGARKTFPTVNPLQPVGRQAGPYSQEAFVSVLSAKGDELEFSTYFGGGAQDQALAIAVDPAGSIYFGGSTFSSTMPKVNSIQGGVNGVWDAFIAKIAPTSSAPAVSIGDAQIAEGQSGTKTLQIPVTLSTASSQTVTVSYATSDDTAEAGTDYLAASGTLTFSPGVTSQNINITIVGDTATEGGADETFGVELGSVTNAFASRVHSVVTILADDATRSLQLWNGFFAPDLNETPEVGDFNGDGKTDIITFTRGNPAAVGDVYVQLSTGSRFGATDSATKWHDWFAINNDETVVIGDYDGDGKDDIATWLRTSTRQVYVARSLGTGMASETVWLADIGFHSTDILLAGDADGDGRKDLILFARRQGKVYVALSTGSAFAAPTLWHSFFAVSTYERPRVADVDGDGKVDILTFATDSPTAFGDVYVALSTGTQFGDKANSTKWHDFFAIRPTEQIRTGDLDNDGKADFYTFLPPPFGQCYTVRSLGTGLGPNVLWPEVVAPLGTDTPFVGDVNGDGKADVIVFDRIQGKVYVSLAP